MKTEKRAPNFIIAGAQRSGSTWLRVLLDKHPDVYMAQPVNPEPKFFLLDELYERGLDYYLETWFAKVPEKKVAGEKSALYLQGDEVASRICKLLPDIKLIFILRNPVERAYSNYLFSFSNNLEEKDFATALELEKDREKEYKGRLKNTRPNAYFARGLYADMLQNYFDTFNGDQMLFLRFEDIKEKPEFLIKSLCDFLEVADHRISESEPGIVNPSAKHEPMPDEIRVALTERYREPNQKLAQMLGERFEIWDY